MTHRPIGNQKCCLTIRIHFTVLLAFLIAAKGIAQDAPLSPLNNTAIDSLLKTETYNMTWLMVQDSVKLTLGNIQTQIQKKNEEIFVITTVELESSASRWIDSTIVRANNFKPIYHSSFNEQRDIVLKFGPSISGYYFDKQNGTKKQISTALDGSFFDSNFYPQLIRILPLKEGYSNSLLIFDYNPTANTGVVSATVKSTVRATIMFHGRATEVWKVITTDDISNNTTISTYYIELSTRKLLKQEIEMSGRKMLMERVEH